MVLPVVVFLPQFSIDNGSQTDQYDHNTNYFSAKNITEIKRKKYMQNKWNEIEKKNSQQKGNKTFMNSSSWKAKPANERVSRLVNKLQ